MKCELCKKHMPKIFGDWDERRLHKQCFKELNDTIRTLKRYKHYFSNNKQKEIEETIQDYLKILGF